MDTFTEAYNKGLGLLKTKCFEPRWSQIEVQLKSLLAADGPNDGAAGVLDVIRTKLEDAGSGEEDTGGAIADEMLTLSRSDAHGYQDRAAFLEMLRHFYLVRLTHNQRVWVLDGALSISRWIYDEFDGQTKAHLKRKLAHQPFLAFGSNDRDMFAEALTRA